MDWLLMLFVICATASVSFSITNEDVPELVRWPVFLGSCMALSLLMLHFVIDLCWFDIVLNCKITRYD